MVIWCWDDMGQPQIGYKNDDRANDLIAPLTTSRGKTSLCEVPVESGTGLQ
jgi:hypothetical protein